MPADVLFVTLGGFLRATAVALALIVPVGAASADECVLSCDSPPTIPPVVPPTKPPPPPDTKAMARRLFNLMNQERTSRGLAPFTRRADVDAIAVGHSGRMAAKGTIWHNDEYFSPATKDRLQAAYLGENVARNADIDDMHRRLMNSPHHRDNILNPRFTQVGVGVAVGENGGLFGTENFMQPRTPRPSPPPPKPKPRPVERPRAAPAAPAHQPVAVPVEATPVEFAFPYIEMAGAEQPGPLPRRPSSRSAGFVALSALAALALAATAGKGAPSAVRFGRYPTGDPRARGGRRRRHPVVDQHGVVRRGIRRGRGGRRP